MLVRLGNAGLVEATAEARAVMDVAGDDPLTGRAARLRRATRPEKKKGPVSGAFRSLHAGDGQWTVPPSPSDCS